MKRSRLRLLALPFAVLALLAAVGSASADDVNGPKCADITDPDFHYASDELTVDVNLHLDTASCTSVSYTLIAQDDATTNPPRVAGTDSARGDGTPLPNTTVDVVILEAVTDEEDGSVCVYATTSVGRHIFDRAPDTGCITLGPGGTGGGSGFS